MKKWFKEKKTQIIIGGCMMIFSVILGVWFSEFLAQDSEMWMNFIYFFIVGGSLIGGLAGALIGRRGFFYGYILMVIIIAPFALPEPYKRYYSIIYLALLFVIPAIRNRRKKAKEKAEKAGYSPLEEGADTEFATESEMEFAGILAFNNANGRIYQMIRYGGFVHAYHVGGELSGPDPQLFHYDGEPLRPKGKKDFAIAVEDIIKIKIKDLSGNTSGFHYLASIKTGKKRYVYYTVRGMMDDSFYEFWRDLGPTELMDNKNNLAANENKHDEKSLKTARAFKLAFCIYLGIVALAWLFLNVPYMLFAALNLLALPLIMLIYFVFQKETTLFEAKNNTQEVSIFYPAMLSGFAVCLRTLLDFNVLNWDRFLLVSAVFAVVILLIFLLCSKEWRKTKKAIGYFIIPLLVFSFGAPMQLNVMLDFSEPIVEEAEIVDMWISTSTKSPDSYEIEVEIMDGNTLTLKISEEFYNQLDVGDAVDVRSYPGFFGIKYASAA